ncbi:MAG TPA: LamG domain-containing protein [Candidatus Eisenbacteria bacterium]
MVLTALLVSVSCVRGQRPPGTPAAPAAPSGLRAPEPDSLTVALWHLDESSGTQVADAGPFRLDGTAGIATRVQFGRIDRARGFERSLDSFVYVPYDRALETPRAFTIEAWLRPRSFGPYEDTPIVGRWSLEANRQSWLFALAGRRLVSPTLPPSPGLHLSLFPETPPGHLLFAFQPEAAGPPRGFASARPISLERWTHVAVTFDGEVLKFFLDGVLDAQYATADRIRATPAGLLVGNAFDPRNLTRFGGDLRLDPTGGAEPRYGFDGWIDELRISNAAREDFPTVVSR